MTVEVGVVVDEVLLLVLGVEEEELLELLLGDDSDRVVECVAEAGEPTGGADRWDVLELEFFDPPLVATA